MLLFDLRNRAVKSAMILMALVTGSFVHANESDTAIASRVINISTTDDAATMRCVGTLLTPKLLITAAHCIEESLQWLSIECLRESEDTQALERQIVQVYTHSNHDIAIVALNEDARCSTSNALLALSSQKATTLFTLNVSVNARNMRNQLDILQTNAETYIVDDKACLTQGDSGTPAFTTDPRGDLELAAILISGTDECPAIQILANVSDFYDWMETVVVLPISSD